VCVRRLCRSTGVKEPFKELRARRGEGKTKVEAFGRLEILPSVGRKRAGSSGRSNISHWIS
jgi:hypothetical protein